MSAVIAWLAHRRFNYLDLITGLATGICAADGLYWQAAVIFIVGVFASSLVTAIVSLKAREGE
jgi:hypothetical protein